MRKTYTESDIRNLLKQQFGKGDNQSTQNEWCSKNGIHPSVVSRFLSGKDGLYVIANALGFEAVTVLHKKREEAK